MANEAVIIELLGNKGDPVSFSCLDGDAIEKGALLCIDTGSGKIRYISGSTSTHVTGGYPVAGIAAAEKVASDGQTQIAVYTNGIFDLKLNTDTCAIGDLVTISGANMIGPERGHTKFLTDNPLRTTLGVALETGTTTATVAVRVGPL